MRESRMLCYVNGCLQRQMGGSRLIGICVLALFACDATEPTAPTLDSPVPEAKAASVASTETRKTPRIHATPVPTPEEWERRRPRMIRVAVNGVMLAEDAGTSEIEALLNGRSILAMEVIKRPRAQDIYGDFIGGGVLEITIR